jgi:hypothetical protein
VTTPIERICIALTLPPTPLSPNERPNRWVKADTVAGYRDAAHAKALFALARRPPPRWVFSRVTYRFCFTDWRRHDADNAIAAAKPGLDGIVDAGILADDAGAELICQRRYGQAVPELLVMVKPRDPEPGETRLPPPRARKARAGGGQPLPGRDFT